MKIRHLDFDKPSANAEHDALALPPIEYEVIHAFERPVMQLLTFGVVGVLTGLVVYLMHRLFMGEHDQTGMALVKQTLHDPMFWTAVAVGLLAQAIDGALGMAYGITSSSFLLAAGAPPAMASGAVHLAEVFTTGVSGVSHLRLGNVSKTLFLSLLLPGIVGALIGVYILGQVDAAVLKPVVSAYLLLMGVYVFSKAFRHADRSASRRDLSPRKVAPLALVGGLMDTTGGGGWGPIVTTSLVGAGNDPRTTIGSVNLAEFFLTVTVAASFLSILDATVWVLVAGLATGGLVAAPFAACMTKYLKAKTLLMLVGALISSISVFNLYKVWATI
jgi:uncharacterized membrane protein YfcA